MPLCTTALTARASRSVFPKIPIITSWAPLIKELRPLSSVRVIAHSRRGLANPSESRQILIKAIWAAYSRTASSKSRVIPAIVGP